jgi:hypothetical protein
MTDVDHSRDPVALDRITMSDPACRSAPDSRSESVPVEPPLRSADGIRWDLVNRMKQLIGEGTLDTPERWAAAEEMMFRAIEERR